MCIEICFFKYNVDENSLHFAVTLAGNVKYESLRHVATYCILAVIFIRFIRVKFVRRYVVTRGVQSILNSIHKRVRILGNMPNERSKCGCYFGV